MNCITNLIQEDLVVRDDHCNATEVGGEPCLEPHQSMQIQVVRRLDNE